MEKNHVSLFQTELETSTTKASKATANSLYILSKTLGFGKAIKNFTCTVSELTTDNKSETCAHFCSRFTGERRLFQGQKSLHPVTQGGTRRIW